LSYSHRDKAWAKWLHAALEGYRIEKDLVGRETPVGPVPKTMRPISQIAHWGGVVRESGIKMPR
jgi:hypothetical protein